MNNGSSNHYPNTGALFPRPKKSENSPEMGGDFSIDGEVKAYVIQCIKANQPIKLELSGWRKTDRNGKPFYSLKVRTPWETRDGADHQKGRTNVVAGPGVQGVVDNGFNPRDNGMNPRVGNSYAAASGVADNKNPWEL